MNFQSMNELKLWAKFNKNANFDGGSQGECFRIGNKVYKIFIQYLEEDYYDMISYNKEDIMKFSDIINNTYIWPNDVILVGDIVVGYIMDYVAARPLSNINPLSVNLDNFEKFIELTETDIKVISDNGVKTFDVMYNILYGKDGFKVIDSVEYSKVDIDCNELYRTNYKNFYYEIRLFLIDGYFDDFIFNSNYLYRLYYDQDVSFIDFWREFKNELSMVEGHEIKRLEQAKKSLVRKKREEANYIREF